MDAEKNLKAGDVCEDCQQLGLVKYLRYFKINLNGDTLLKCESNECMYPYNDDISSSSDEEPEEEDVKEDLVEANSLKFIDDFLQEYAKGNEQEGANPNEPKTTDQFDMSFLDNLQDVIKENHGEEGFGIESNGEFHDNKENDKVIENHLMGIINPNENLEENKIIGENVEEASKRNEDKMIENQLNELLTTNEFTGNNFEVLDNKNNEILLLDSLNSIKCDITTAAIEECSNDKETISFLTLIDNPSEASKANETEVNELKSNLETDKQTSLLTLMEDNVKDCKPKIDIQSIETIKVEPSFCNILPTTCDIKIATSETFSNNSHTSTLKTVKKTTKKSQTKAPKKHSTIKPSQSSITNELANETINTPTPSNTSSTSADIPKANILKGSDILKKLAIIDEKSSKMNTKLKSARTNKKFALNHPPELTPPPNPTQQKIDTDFSFDKLTEILIANKLKRENKNS